VAHYHFRKCHLRYLFAAIRRRLTCALARDPADSPQQQGRLHRIAWLGEPRRYPSRNIQVRRIAIPRGYSRGRTGRTSRSHSQCALCSQSRRCYDPRRTSRLGLVLAGQRAEAAVASQEATPEAASDVTTTGGKAGYLPEFNGATTVVDSPVFVLGSDIGIGTATPTATLDVSGTALVSGLLTAGGATLDGSLTLSSLGTGTASGGFDSQLLKIEASAYNSSSKSVVNPRFEWQAVHAGNDTATPSATLELLSSTSTSSASPTGFFFNANGTVNFAPGQTLPGADITGTVNASGYDLGGSLFATGSTAARSAYLGFAGNTSSSGTEDTGVGYQALHTNTTGSYDTANGFQAPVSNTTGNDDTAVGEGALANNTTGNENTANGFQALFSNTTGGENTGSGVDALVNNTTGSSNTAIGYLAGPDSSSTSLTYSTAVGAYATVSQSNSVVLGQTTTGMPGGSYVNVGIALPRRDRPWRRQWGRRASLGQC